ncbi:BglG family transcription antiterminator [Alkaliphilus peptidifermentans]|uniref:Transcriptional antiterminator n=1 Tax=Alkaliphilus peptidifermentans DSM 18978 TaxID=1120976 RepID=A0A1G5AEY3_9FIRM|nr:BglG family transcription antiterminator [Alkaliphilus peptidifermentans]SCX76409.1 Transcriptional antiterminator [Alkaliphilus peptidifermentans DSM 18978]
MKERDREILEEILNKEGMTLKKLLEIFKISKRTLYYSIQEINDYIRVAGMVKRVDKKITFVGDMKKLKEIIEAPPQDMYFDYVKRKAFLLKKIFMEEEFTIDQMAEELLVSKNTIFNTITAIKEELSSQGITLRNDGYYRLEGDENKIRELFIVHLDTQDFFVVQDLKILTFDHGFKLHLTDISLFYLSMLLDFISLRIERGAALQRYDFCTEAKKLPYFHDVEKLLYIEINEYEKAYLSAYISSLSNRNPHIKENLIIKIVARLVEQFKQKTSIYIENEEKLKQNLIGHFLASYNRIRFQIPVVNPLLEEIKEKYQNLFTMTKLILEDLELFPELKGIREDEIAYISTYFGAYFKEDTIKEKKQQKTVLIVCHKGVILSKILESQIREYFPFIQIIAAVPIKDIIRYNNKYDFIISTVDLEEKEKVIVVNPIFTKYDLQLLYEKLMGYGGEGIKIDINLLMSIVGEYATIHNEKKLKQEILQKIYKLKKKESEEPMLKELLTANHIIHRKRADDWEEAIKTAAAPLVEDKSVDTCYVDAMIKSVYKHGPYIVLTDYFALPHARPEDGVQRLSMSMLILQDPVDLLGKPVHIFVVLGSIDNSSHLRALASLTEFMGKEENIKNVIASRTTQEIIHMIHKNEEEV